MRLFAADPERDEYVFWRDVNETLFSPLHTFSFSPPILPHSPPHLSDIPQKEQLCDGSIKKKLSEAELFGKRKKPLIPQNNMGHHSPGEAAL